MAIDTPARHIYTGNGNQRVFPIPTKIIGDDYIRIEIDSIYQSDRTKWDIVNNSVIFITAPLNGATVDIQVATSEEALSVLGSSTSMDIVAESIPNVNTVATNIAHVTNVSHNITEMTTVSNNVSSVVITANDSDEINILASIHTQLESLYADRNKITSLYNDKTTLDSIYSDKAKLDAIFNDLAAIEGLYSIKVKLESIYADKSKLESIYADKTKLDSIYADKTQIDTLYNNISNILTVYTNIASVIAVSNNIASVNTTADNIVDINTFSNRYKVSSTQPSSAIAGDLWYDTIATVLKYYNGSSYVAVSPDITLLLTNTKFISNISIGNTTLSGWTNSFNVIEAPGGTFFASNGVATLTGSNCYYDGVNWKYKVDGTAGLQLVNQGTHTFKTAISGSAGDIITWVTQATIDSTGITGASNLVVLSGNQTIDGVKTFTSSPIVPIPTENTQVANKEYVDSVINVGTNGAYGLKWNQETDVYQVLGATNRTQIQRNMKRCVLKDNGTVNYYLDHFISTLKADGTPAVLTGADGNVMVEVPKFWYKHELNGNEHQWWVSDKPLDGYSVHPWFLEGGVEIPFRYYRAYTPTVVSGKLRSISGSTPTRSQTRNTFRTQARANGTGWGLASWNGLNAIQLLFITEFGTFNTQAILGRGNDTGSDYGITTGQSNVIGNASSGALNNDMWMSYRGIENWYGDCWEFIDGINISNYVVYLSNTPSSFADDTYTGSYSNSGITLPAMNASYIKKISGNFIPTAVGGSSSTFITDGGWSSAGESLVLFGGAADNGLIAGGFAFSGNAVASSAVAFAAGLTR